jgi:hypothetical protein
LEKKSLISYGTNEASILSTLEERKVLPSMNEGWRRGVQALDFLAETDDRMLFDLLSSCLMTSKESIDDHQKFLRHLQQANALSNVIQAVQIAKVGLPAATFLDAFTPTLREYSALSDFSVFEKTDKTELARSLAGLSYMALSLSKKNGLNWKPETERDLAYKKMPLMVAEAKSTYHNIPRVSVSRGDSLADFITKFFDSDWGRSPRTLSDVREALQAYGLNYPKQSIAVALIRLSKQGVLWRMKNESGEFHYKPASLKSNRVQDKFSRALAKS